MASTHPYYMIWTGALNLGDTPGVFMDAQFVGLQLQLPLTLSSAPTAPVLRVLLVTNDVEIFGGKKHPVYWDWNPGDPLPTPVGHIDDVATIPGRPEFHVLEVPAASANPGKHWLTILVNSDVAAGMRDDFVLKRIEMDESVGAKLGW